MDNYGGSGFSGGAQYGANYVEPDPSQQIMVRNVRFDVIVALVI